MTVNDGSVPVGFVEDDQISPIGDEGEGLDPEGTDSIGVDH